MMENNKLDEISVIKDYLTTAADGKPCHSLSPVGGGRGWKNLLPPAPSKGGESQKTNYEYR